MLARQAASRWMRMAGDQFERAVLGPDLESFGN